MALVINDRVKETTTTTGTGAVSLSGAVTGFETFAAGIGNSNTVYYCIAHQDQAEFEVGLGTLDGDSSDLTRTTVISSSNSDSAVNFSSGTKDVFCTLPASKLIFEDGSNNVAFGGAITGVTNLTASGELDAATLDISGDADIDGTLEADAITLNGTALSSTFASLSGATFTGNIEIDVASGDPAIILDTQGADKFHFAVDDSDSDNLTVEGGVIALKNTGAQSELRLYCESSNAHYAALKAPAHADFSGNTALTLPATTDTIAGIAATQTLTNKSIDSDNNTITNIVNADIKSSAAIVDTKLATISTAGKVALTALEIDGGSDIGADLTTSDLIIVDDGAGGTNRKAALSRVVTLMTAQGFSTEDPTALAIALG